MAAAWTARFRWDVTRPGWVPALILSGVGWGALGGEPAPDSDFAAPIRPLLETYCVDCHGREKTEGGVDLTGLRDERNLVESGDLWRRVIDQVASGEMPPRGASPTAEERDRLAGWLRNRWEAIDWSRYRGVGHVTLPRLTKAEYRNTMRDLLGVDLGAGEELPEDGEGASGFTNDRDALALAPAQIESFLDAAGRAVAGALALGRPPARQSWEAEGMTRHPSKIPARGDGVFLVHPEHELRVDWAFPVDGWYRFRLLAATRGGPECRAEIRIDGEVVASAAVPVSEAGVPPEVEAVGFVRAGSHSVSVQSRNLVPQVPLPPDIVRQVNERARVEAPRLAAFAVPEPPAVREAREDLNLKAWGVQECYEWLRVLGPRGDPRQIDLRRSYLREREGKWSLQVDRLSRAAGVPAAEIDRLWRAENHPRIAENAEILNAVSEVEWDDWSRWQGRLWVDRCSVEGPVRPRAAPRGWTLVDCLFVTRADPDRAIAELLPRAFRRPVGPDEASRYLALLDSARQRGAPPEEALATALTAVLVSPRFLFRDELPAESGGGGPEARPLGDYELASRLSYFLWQSMPDEELFDLAAAGLLSDPDSLAAQADRLLDDPRADAFFEAFAGDWLGIRELGRSVLPDPGRFPEFDATLAAAMREETRRTLAAVFRSGRPVSELIDSDVAHWNGALAAHYGHPGIAGEHFRVVALGGKRRGGLLGMGSVLTVTSSPARTNPVRRGAWVLERILGEDPGEPLPTAGELPGDAGEARGRTLREELDLHRTRAECAKCHERIDPIGFGLESYDAIGRWREREAGQPVDARGRFPDGREFAGPEELKEVLGERIPQMEVNLLRRLLAYALGRRLDYYDEPGIREMAAELRAAGGSTRTLVRLVVTSDPFRNQAPPEEARPGPAGLRTNPGVPSVP